MIELFKDPDILSSQLKIEIVHVRGKIEDGADIGVVRDAFFTFFQDFNYSYTVGREEKIPSLRHDLGKDEWQSVARILIHLFKRNVGCLPIVLSSSFMVPAVFGDSAVGNDNLKKLFKNYISLDEKDLIESSAGFENIMSDVTQMLSDYDCRRIQKSKPELMEILLETRLT